MKGNNTRLILAVFKGKDKAETVMEKLPKRDRHIVSAVIVTKDANEQISFRDVGRTPRRGTAEGTILGGVIGLLTGGTGLALGALGGVIGHHSGKDQPIINILNDVFYKYGVEWDISITKKFGDATEFARQAAEAGFDLVVGYGGDGTQHEIVNGVMGTGVPMGILPGGTGNGFGNEMGIPSELRPAVELLCTSYNQRKIDIVKLEDWEEEYFVQRLFTGIEPDEQTSREDKNKYGTLAYLGRDIKRIGEIQDIKYTLKIDGEEIEILGHKCYVVNSAKTGTGLSISEKFKVDDGILDVFMLSRDKKSSNAALNRFFNLENEKAGMYYWRGQEIEIDAETDQPVWTDGEYTGRTPVSMKVVPAGLTVAVP